MRYKLAERSWLERIFALLVSLAIVILGFMFSLLLIAVLVVVGLVDWAYFRWKFRARSTQSRVIEGEAVIINEHAESGGPPRLQPEPGHEDRL